MAGGGGADKKLKDLLKMTLKLTDQEEKHFDEIVIEKERKEWLQQAIQHAIENDEAKKLKMYTDLLLSHDFNGELTDNQQTDILTLIEAINLLVEGLDVALDFNNMGGLKHCIKILKCNYMSLQWNAADLIANCSLNNPDCQKTLLENNAVEVLLHLLKTNKVELVRLKSLYALSTLIGHFPPAEELFIRLSGVDLIVKIMKEESGKIKFKAVFMLRKIVNGDNNQYKNIKPAEVCKELVAELCKPRDETHEYVADMIHHLLSNDAEILKAWQASKQSLVNLLKERINHLTEEAYEREVDFYKSIMLQLLLE